MKYSRRLKGRGEPRNATLEVKMTAGEIQQLAALQNNLDPGVYLSRGAVVRKGLDLLHQLVKSRVTA
jgi:hypothetical protein